MKIKVNYIRDQEQLEMCKINVGLTDKTMIVNVGGRLLPF